MCSSDLGTKSISVLVSVIAIMISQKMLMEEQIKAGTAVQETEKKIGRASCRERV